MNHHVDSYVFGRIDEGYGPTEYSCQQIMDLGAQLLITIDCGTNSYEALRYVKQIGLDIIIIDHYISTSVPLESIVIINLDIIDETNNFICIAAIDVAFLFAITLLSELRTHCFFKRSNLQI